LFSRGINLGPDQINLFLGRVRRCLPFPKQLNIQNVQSAGFKDGGQNPKFVINI